MESNYIILNKTGNLDITDDYGIRVEKRQKLTNSET